MSRESQIKKSAVTKEILEQNITRVNKIVILRYLHLKQIVLNFYRLKK